jgi:hypothetical protein
MTYEDKQSNAYLKVTALNDVATYLVDTSALIAAMNTMGNSGKTMSTLGNGVNNAYDLEAVFNQARLSNVAVVRTLS